ncbi:MAG: hypothetical protein JWP04_352 [Belnapia sp.]|nr:hypothetical protein [Belnapia sp.]
MRSLWNGVPNCPERSGWHWVEDATGLRPLLWRGDDWPDAIDRREWEDGIVVCSAEDMRGSDYCGPVVMPEVVAERFNRTRLGKPPVGIAGGWAARLGLS